MKFLWRSSQIVHMTFKKLLKLLYGLRNRSFCQLDISKVQLKSNWIVGERQLASDQSQFGIAA